MLLLPRENIQKSNYPASGDLFIAMQTKVVVLQTALQVWYASVDDNERVGIETSENTSKLTISICIVISR